MIEVDASTIEPVGEEVTRVVRVYNNGTEDALDAVVQINFSDQLENVRWQRRPSYAKYIHDVQQPFDWPPPRIDLWNQPATRFGDINGDGFDDYASLVPRSDGTTIYLGNERASSADTVTAEEITDWELSQFETPKRCQYITSVGDLNQDGLADFAFDLELVLASSMQTSGDTFKSITIDTGISSGYGPIDSHVLPAGDVSGDGIDDVLFLMPGPAVQTTQSGRTVLETVSGVGVLFGSKDLEARSSLDVQQDGARFTGTRVFGRGGVRDINLDGVNDLVISSFGQLVIFGGPDLQSHDFGFETFESFDGEFGLGILPRDQGQPRTSITVPNAASVEGSGNVTELLDIPAGTGWIYTATGILEEEAAEQITATVGPDALQTDSDLQNNSVGTDAVSLLTSIQHDVLQIGEVTNFEVVVQNVGTTIATDVNLSETLSRSLDEPSWSMQTTSLFPDEVTEWDIGLGPWEHGFSRTAGNEEDVFWRVLPNLGKTGGPLGDINGDGFDDVFLESNRHLILYFGGPGIGQSGGLDDIAEPVRIGLGRSQDLGEIRPLGDVDGDGFDDFRVGGNIQRVLYGQESFSVSESFPGTIRSTPAEQLRIAAGDINGDGLLDSIIDSHIELGAADGEAVVLETTQPNVQLAPVGDLNADDFDDFAVVTRNDNDWFVRTRIVFGRGDLGEGQDFFELGIPLVSPTGDAGSVLFSRERGYDLNGDSIPDIVFREELGGGENAFRVLFGKRTLHEQVQLSGAVFMNGIDDKSSVQPLTIGDFNDDGFDDVATILNDIWISFGGVDFPDRDPMRVELDSHSGLDWTTAMVTAGFDLNADGIEDLLIANPGNPPHSDGFGSAGAGFFLLGRRGKNTIGNGTFNQQMDLYPGEAVTIRLSGTVTARTLADVAEVSLGTSSEQRLLNPLSSVAHFPIGQSVADIDGDGTVDFSDFLILSNNFGASDLSPSDGDLNGDRAVDFVDFLILAANFGRIS